MISAVFALPIAVELALHWPGNFGKYFAYSGSAQSGGHPAAQVVHYVLWFWWPHRHAWAVAAVLVTAAAVAAWVMPSARSAASASRCSRSMPSRRSPSPPTRRSASTS